MGYGQGYKFFCLFVIIATTCGLPRINDDQPSVGLGTENVALNILKTKFNTRENVVFAPFGYSSILAMLSEGARGETQREIRDFLRLSTSSQRKTFRAVMTRYSGDEPSLVPQFKTWFYVYRNNTVSEEFIKTLRDDYLVEVKTIERDFYDFDVPASDIASEGTKEEALADAKPPVAVKESEAKLSPVVDDEDTFDVVDFEEKKVPGVDIIDEIIKQKECSRFDEAVDESQYVEVQKLREENAAAATAAEDNETVHPIEKLEEMKKLVKIDDTLKRLDEEERGSVLQVAKKHPVTKKFQAAGRSLEEINDVSSALSGNSLTDPKEDGSQEQQSKMLLFNGLYFRGKWKTPFQRLRLEVAEPGTVFYLQDEVEPMEVAMMRSRGQYETGYSDTHKAQIIELPYEDERYAMLVVMPVERDNGLKNLVERLDYATIKQLSSNLKMRTVDLSLPKFNVDTTSTVHKEFAEMGLATLFSDAADLSGITKEQRLRVDELVQHVSVRVDEGASSENSISASNAVPKKSRQSESAAVTTTGENEEYMFIVDRPFLFFVRDKIDDVTLVAGLINRPQGPQLFAEFVTQDRATAGSASAARENVPVEGVAASPL